MYHLQYMSFGCVCVKCDCVSVCIKLSEQFYLKLQCNLIQYNAGKYCLFYLRFPAFDSCVYVWMCVDVVLLCVIQMINSQTKPKNCICFLSHKIDRFTIIINMLYKYALSCVLCEIDDFCIFSFYILSSSTKSSSLITLLTHTHTQTLFLRLIFV